MLGAETPETSEASSGRSGGEANDTVNGNNGATCCDEDPVFIENCTEDTIVAKSGTAEFIIQKLKHYDTLDLKSLDCDIDLTHLLQKYKIHDQDQPTGSRQIDNNTINFELSVAYTETSFGTLNYSGESD